MKRFLLPLLCAALVVSLGACDTWWNLLVAGITGKGYYQVSRSTVSGVTGSMSTSSIDVSSLGTSAVIVYETGSPDLRLGKLALTTTASSTSITIQFVTYSSDGSTYKSSNSRTVNTGQYLDLDADSVSSSTNADFTYDGTSLVPSNSAVFYLYSQ